MSPPSVLRTSGRGTSTNSVGFSKLVETLNTSPLPSQAAAAAAAAGMASGRHKTSASLANTISLDTVVSSQFENEAETHILAALEMEELDNQTQSRLLGEGIDEIGDYSDDDEDDDIGGDQGRNRTWSNDSFLGKLKLQNDLPQYHYSEVGSHSSASKSPPRPQHHRRMLSSTRGSSGYLPSVPDDAALVYDGSTINEQLAMKIQSEQLEEGDDTFLDAAKASTPMKDAAAAAAAAAAGDIVISERHAEDGEQKDGSGTSGAKSKGGEASGEHTTAAAEVNLMTHTTEATENMNFMAQRLHSLQKKRSDRRLSSSKRSSMANSDRGLVDGESSGDRLIDALNSVDTSKNTSFSSKVRNEWTDLIAPKLPQIMKNASHMLLLFVFPFLSVAAILFYMFDNPMAGESGTSISWWILFLGVRQALTFGFTRVGEVFWVEVLALRSKLFNLAVGPYISLAVIQSKGWPYIICFWAVLDFCFLYGSHEFAKHWLFWQDKLDLFNASNPVVGVTDDVYYMRLLISAIFVGVASSSKRLWLSIYLGRRTVAHFGEELEKLLAKMILIGEVANLARDIEKKRSIFDGQMSPMDDLGDTDKLVRFQDYMRDEYSSAEESPLVTQRKSLDTSPLPSTTPPSGKAQRKVLEVPTPSSDGLSQGASPGRPRHSPPRPMNASAEAVKKKLETSSVANVKLMNLLSEWEEPELIAGSQPKATVRDLLEFRKAVSYMDDKYPFSHAFGHAKTRETCVQSSQEVYDRLMLSAGDCPNLPFSVISVLAMDENGEFIDSKIKSLIRLFRPDRQGNLSKLDFVKSIDTVYKQLRLLRASIANSSQIDHAFEKIVNGFFYFFLVIIAVAILGIDIWTVFLSFNTFFLGFSFLFGSAASNYFEGLLLIFVRRPYDIGDRIATSNPKLDTSPNGSSTWYVDKVTLYTTTVRFATTNEVATYSNGSLAILRIINANRSPKAIIGVLIKFGLETPFSKITVFRAAVENFIKARPREWIAMVGFRATRVEADIGFVEYKIIAQHRESWQNIGPILQSKADLSSFCLEATKKLDMKYESPPMPVNLSVSDNGIFQGEADELKGGGMAKAGDSGKKSLSAEDLQEVANLFEIRKRKKSR
ncbi:hypothetical protein ACHAXT_005902 [Thalassiosira profunda]